jgi:hypothetical protein
MFYFLFEIKQEILRKLNVKIKEKDYKILETFLKWMPPSKSTK